ncbi:dehydrogenase, partial [Streptomyces tricolor]
MRIGILGLGRIGAFHAETLSGLDAGEERGVRRPQQGRAPAAPPRGVADGAQAPGGPRA